MSEPVHLLNIKIIDNGDMSGDIVSLDTNIDEGVTYSIQSFFTGSPVGTIEARGSNEIILPNPPGSAVDPTKYTIITDSVQAVNGAGSYLLNVEFPGYSHVILTYTRTSGTGTLNSRINAKRR